jgi:ABC-2 type transport system permease protein
VSLQPLHAIFSQDQLENPHLLLLGPADFAFVVVALLPLLIVALSYHLLSLERETGTLALVRSQPVRLAEVVAGKMVARLGLLLAVIVAVVALAGAAGGGLSAGRDGRLVAVFAAIALYGLFWFLLAVLVNACRWTSGANAIALLAAWLAVVVVGPATVNAVAARLHPAPSRVVLVQALRRATDAAETRAADLLRAYYRDHPEMAPRDANASMSDFYARTMVLRAQADRAAAPVMAHFTAQVEAQRRFTDRLRLASPAVLVRAVLDEAAGTSDARYRDFFRQVATYHEEWGRFFAALIFREARMTPEAYDRLPRFRYAPEPEPEIRGRIWALVGGLLAPVVVLGVADALILGRRGV